MTIPSVLLSLLFVMYALMGAGCSEPIARAQLDECIELVGKTQKNTDDCISSLKHSIAQTDRCLAIQRR